MSFSENLQYLRKKQNLTQEQCGVKTQINHLSL